MAYSGLTQTQVLRYLNRTLGTLLQEMELTEEEMMRVVFQESLATYSKFYPYKYRLTVNQAGFVPGSLNTYEIPNTDNLEIIGIHKVFISNMAQFGSTMVPLSYNPFESQIFNDYVSMTVTPVTWQYLPPNQVTVFPKIINYQSAILEVKAIHPKHLKTIPMNMRDEFLKLCMLDVLVSLYPLRHRFESFTTPYGTMQPFMEMVDRSTDERKELLERWNTLYLKDATAKRIFIA
jgi:hypothetical protein